MHLSRLCLGHLIPWKKVPGSLWGGKQRKIPRLTHARKEAFLNELLISRQNHRYLQNPCIDQTVDMATLNEFREIELRKEDEVFYSRYKKQFNERFPTRKIEEFWSNLNVEKRFDV